MGGFKGGKLLLEHLESVIILGFDTSVMDKV